MSINLKGTFFLCQSVLKEMKKYQKGKIVNMDFGCENEKSVDYPDIGFKVAIEVKKENVTEES